MPSQVSLWSSPDRWFSLTLRWRPALLTVLALAAGYTIYHHRDSIPFTETPTGHTTDLRRSNAVRLRRTQADLDRSDALRLRRAQREQEGNAAAFLEDERESWAILGFHYMRTPGGGIRQFALHRDVLDSYDRHPLFAGDMRGRHSLERAFLRLYFHRNLFVWLESDLPSTLGNTIINRMRDLGYSEDVLRETLNSVRLGSIRTDIGDWLVSQELLVGPDGNFIREPGILDDIRAFQARTTVQETVADTDSDHSVHEEEGHDDDEPKTRVLNLLFRIAEEQSRREGYVHRGVTCNGCGTCPLKGIRYRCSNCDDFDLCENCESRQFHQKNHIFFKVRIPSPYVRNQSLDVMYPAKHPASDHHLTKQSIKRFSENTGYRENEIEGFWEQFKCIAATEWPTDPHEHYLAIDHRSFEQLFIHTNSGRPPPPNLVYDRVFHFFDYDNDNLIGFEEFVTGLANLNKKGPKQKWSRIFRCYDLDGDGYVDRKDFLRIFKAHYALTQEMTAEIVAHMEEDFTEEETRELIAGGRPLAAAFTEGSVGEGRSPPEMGEGKRLDRFGDPVVVDNEATVNDRDHLEVETAEAIADFAEQNEFGDVKHHEKDIEELVHEVYQAQLPRLLEIYQSYFNAKHAKPSGNEFLGIDWTRQEHDAFAAAKVHLCLAVDWRSRHFVRCSAVKDRKKRKEIFLANGGSNHPKMNSRSGDSHNSGHASIRKARQAVFQDEESSECFRREAVHLYESLTLPPEHEFRAFFRHMMRVSELEWSEDEVVEGLRGHFLDRAQVRNFVGSWFKLLEEHAAPPPPEDETIKIFAPPSRRSRSSSKVRFEDGLTSNDDEPDTRSVTSISSRSIPVNERWGGFELPEPEEDFGREVLYEVVQESMNNLIDPLFKVREDLWIEAQMTKTKRRKHERMILDALYQDVNRPTMLLDYLHIFLRQARFRNDYPPSSDPKILPRLGADNFWQFLSAKLKGKENALTGLKCSSCEDGWIWFGGWCRCGTGSAQTKSLLSDRIQQKDQWTRNVLSNLNDTDDSSSSSASLNGAADRNGMEGNAESSAAEGEDAGESTKADASTKVASPGPGSPNDRSASPSGPSSHPDNSSEPMAISQAPPDANHVDGQSMEVSVQTAQNGADSTEQEYPEMAHELHSAVRSFNEADLSVEETTARKPLQELLEESGYATVDPLHKGDPQFLSPATPPPLTESHPPRISSLSNGTVEEEEEEDEGEDRPDPTLPQNRPGEFLTGGIYESILEEEARRLDPSGSLKHSKPKGNKGKKKKEPKPPDEDELLFWAALMILEAEDEKRGGPGRLSETEFLEIMMNERGRKLDFLGDWMNMTVF